MSIPNQLKNVTCPCCDLTSSRDEWYALSSDYNAVCPKCESYIEYEELKTDNEFTLL